jgi:hypothetical protein
VKRITFITGYPGAGKTTYVRHKLLADYAKLTAALIYRHRPQFMNTRFSKRTEFYSVWANGKSQTVACGTHDNYASTRYQGGDIFASNPVGALEVLSTLNHRTFLWDYYNVSLYMVDQAVRLFDDVRVWWLDVPRDVAMDRREQRNPKCTPSRSVKYYDVAERSFKFVQSEYPRLCRIIQYKDNQ